MTRKEVIELLMTIQGIHPNFHVQDETVTTNAWMKILKDYPANGIMNALITFEKINTSGFAPSPGQLIDCLYACDRCTDMTEQEAWNVVQNALGDSYYNAEQEFDKLPDDVKRAVGSPSVLRGWGQTNMDSLSVIQSNFQRSYREVIRRKNEMMKYPEHIRKAIEAQQKPLPLIEKPTAATVRPDNYDGYTAEIAEKLERFRNGVR